MLSSVTAKGATGHRYPPLPIPSHSIEVLTIACATPTCRPPASSHATTRSTFDQSPRTVARYDLAQYAILPLHSNLSGPGNLDVISTTRVVDHLCLRRFDPLQQRNCLRCLSKLGQTAQGRSVLRLHTVLYSRTQTALALRIPVNILTCSYAAYTRSPTAYARPTPEFHAIAHTPKLCQNATEWSTQVGLHELTPVNTALQLPTYMHS